MPLNTLSGSVATLHARNKQLWIYRRPNKFLPEPIEVWLRLLLFFSFKILTNRLKIGRYNFEIKTHRSNNNNK